jgi:hypothetical protein
MWRRRRSLTKPNTFLSVCNKILQQINCKLGGQLWALEVSQLIPRSVCASAIDVTREQIPLQKTMLVGIDVCHDTASKSGYPLGCLLTYIHRHSHTLFSLSLYRS